MIIPAIIPQSLKDLREQLHRVTFAEAVQIDVVDGVLAPYTSWPYQGDVRHFDLTEPIDDFSIGIDLMATDVMPAVEEWLQVGVDRIIVHIETVEAVQIAELAAKCHEVGTDFALALNNDTPLTELLPHLDFVDFVQVMGIAEIGAQGQPFDERVIARITQLKNERSDLVISVDGSVNLNTLPALRGAGAERFVVGSAIMKAAQPQIAFNELAGLL